MRPAAPPSLYSRIASSSSPRAELGVAGKHAHPEAIVDLRGRRRTPRPGRSRLPFMASSNEKLPSILQGLVEVAATSLTSSISACGSTSARSRAAAPGLLAPEEVRHQRLHARAVQQGRAIPLAGRRAKSEGCRLCPSTRRRTGSLRAARQSFAWPEVDSTRRVFATDPAQSAADFSLRSAWGGGWGYRLIPGRHVRAEGPSATAAAARPRRWRSHPGSFPAPAG